MNKNLVKYPIRFGTLLLAGAALVACKKEEFTEKDAWNLENQRLTRLAQLKKTADSLARVEREGMFKWQRNLDSLNKINAGGRVFYTVIPVNASEAVFSGGRTEEAITGATVTATQFGRTVTGTGANGVFTFPEMRSGEVTVNVTAPNFTQVNYISNLTPDGGIANDGVVNVGNIIPMFELPGTGSNAAAKFAIVRGQAWFEGDLTDATGQDEIVTPAILGANTNLVTATIDLNRGAEGTTPSWFHRRFITETMDESGTGSTVGGTIRSGAIQRFSFSKAVSYGTVSADGSYSMLMPASAAGLPVRLNYSEFAFNRTYFNSNGELVNGATTPVIRERFLYGPNVTATAIPASTQSSPATAWRVTAFTTAAVGTATFTPQAAGVQATEFYLTTRAKDSALPADGKQASVVAQAGGGLYASMPTVTVVGTNTTAAVFEAKPGLAATTLTAASVATAPSTNALGDFDAALKSVGSVEVTTKGAGYASDLALVFNRTDIVNGAGFGGQTASTGLPGGYLRLSTTTPIQVTDGGFGFVRTGDLTVKTPGTFTNYLPTVVFTETNQSGSADPDRGYNTATPTPTAATAKVFVDYSATYNTGQLGVTGGVVGNGTDGNGVGAIQEIQLDAPGGAYPATSLPFVNFSFGETVSSGGFGGAPANRNLFLSNGAGGIKFNEALAAGDISTIFGAGVTATLPISATAISFTAGWGSRYTFVPKVIIDAPSATLGKVAGLQTALNAIPVEVTVNSNPASTNFGKIVSLLVSNTGNTLPAAVTTGAINTDFLLTMPFSAVPGVDQFILRVQPQRYGNTLAAVGGGTAGRTVATGSALNAYSFSAAAQTEASAAATKLAEAMKGAKSNTTTSGLTTANYLAGNNMLVVFSAPTVGATKRTAFGVPVFNGNTLIGARVLDGGQGYSAPITGTVNFTSTTTAQLVPNPWFQGNVPATGVTGPATVPTVNGVTQDVVSFLNSQVASGWARRPLPTPVKARLVINLTTAGSGYSKAPRFIVSGGGLDLTEYKNTDASTVTGNPKTSTSAGGVLRFNSQIDASGAIVRVGNSDGIVVALATDVTAGLTQVKNADGSLVANTFEFDVDKAPAYVGTLQLSVVDELSTKLTNSLNWLTDAAATTGEGSGARPVFSAGALSRVTLNNSSTAAGSAFLTDANATDAKAPKVDIQTGAAASAVFVAGYNSPLVPGPRTELLSSRGTGATVQSWVTLDPKVAQHQRITAITVTAGGSGYTSFAFINSISRNSGGSLSPSAVTGTTTKMDFMILGGAGTANAEGYNTSFGQTNERFDAHPGRTYVRDVHYGSGQRID